MRSPMLGANSLFSLLPSKTYNQIKTARLGYPHSIPKKRSCNQKRRSLSGPKSSKSRSITNYYTRLLSPSWRWLGASRKNARISLSVYPQTSNNWRYYFNFFDGSYLRIQNRTHGWAKRSARLSASVGLCNRTISDQYAFTF